MTGRADHLALGDWNALCAECGKKFKASMLKRHWQGYYVCSRCWEPRQTQDFVRAVPDVQTPPWVRPPPADIFTFSCDLITSQGIADYGVADCARADYTAGLRPLCTPDGSSSIAGLAVAGCMVAGAHN